MDDSHIPSIIEMSEIEKGSLANYIDPFDNAEFAEWIEQLSITNDKKLLILIEEYVDGIPIDDYVVKNGLQEEAVVNLMLELLQTINKLHQMSPAIIHRDLKPDNILVNKSGDLKIVDFDISRETTSQNESLDKTSDTTKFVTKEYAPPEQFGFSETDPRSDIYTIGILLYELLYKKKYPKNSALKGNVDIFASKATVHPELVRIIRKCTNFSPDNRYKNVDELTKSLKKYKQKNIYRVMLYSAIALIVVVLVAFAPKLIGTKDKDETVGDTTAVYNSDPTSSSSSESDATSSSESSEVSLDSIDDTDKTNIFLDLFNLKTQKAENITMYYYTKDPSITPIQLASSYLKNCDIQNIRISDTTMNSTSLIDTKYITHDKENGIVSIAQEYVETLDTDVSYKIVFDTGETLVSIYLKAVTSLDKVSDFGSQYYYHCASFEYLKSDPMDIKGVLGNMFGRKIKKITIYETGKKLSDDLYEYDPENSTLTFRKAFFENFKDGEYANLKIFCTKNKKLTYDDPLIHTFIVRNEPYENPLMEKRSYTVSENSKKIKLEVDWNDGWKKLQGIYATEKYYDNIKPKYYSIDKSGITLSKKYIKDLYKTNGKGVYTYILEFGDISIKFEITLA
ncbi:MAG: protein kinase [Lachnospiraceae bacterium]|nr:protein kinase [Lachnospiraceae bacterium]